MRMQFDKFQYPPSILRHLYEAMLYPRMIEEKMLVLLRQGRVSKWFSGIGQEAISVGVTKALASSDYILPLHRNLGVFTSRDVPFSRLFAQWQGKQEGFTQGRDRSFHFGSPEHHIVGMISHLGAMHGVADGIALASKLDKLKSVCCVFSGEGGTSEGDFHEALNLAAVWDLPVLFVVENNGYGLSTPTSEQYRCKHIADKGSGYGIRAKTIDGNNILEVFDEVSRQARRMRQKPRPFLLECMTFRMRGHEEASGTKYVPEKLLTQWAKKDPIANYEAYLIREKIISEEEIEEIKVQLQTEIDVAVQEVLAMEEVQADEQKELNDVFSPAANLSLTAKQSTTELRMVDAISEGLREAMRQFPQTVLMGQDVGEYGGVFKVTENFLDEFGKERIRNTPICESAVIGAGLGLSICGKKAVVEMQFADFITCGFNQVVNNLAKTHYRWGQQADVTIRMPTGAGVNAGPFHSQSTEAWFCHVPGLKVVYPSSPEDAKGLMISAVADPNPVLFFEHKKLYRSVKGEVPEGRYTIPIGVAKTVREGDDLSVITYGWGVHWAIEATEKLGLEADIIDLRSLVPWDRDAVEKSVKKTGKVLVLHEDTLTGGFGGELAAWIGEHCFSFLDAPVMRCASLDTPIPMADALENNFLASSRLETALQQLANY